MWRSRTVIAAIAPLAGSCTFSPMSANGMVRPCSRPASKGSWQGAA
jgi:hypothetical protein